MKHLPLSQGLFAIVDDEDFEELSKYKWSALKGRHTFYAARNSEIVNGKRKKIMLHRQILGLIDRKLFCDHRDGDGLNNQRSNLRTCNNAENKRNTGKQKNNTTGFKGVAFNKKSGKFMSRIQTNSNVKYIGIFNCPIDAAKAYDLMAKQLHGEFASLNFPEANES